MKLPLAESTMELDLLLFKWRGIALEGGQKGKKNNGKLIQGILQF